MSRSTASAVELARARVQLSVASIDGWAADSVDEDSLELLEQLRERCRRVAAYGRRRGKCHDSLRSWRKVKRSRHGRRSIRRQSHGNVRRAASVGVTGSRAPVAALRASTLSRSKPCRQPAYHPLPGSGSAGLGQRTHDAESDVTADGHPLQRAVGLSPTRPRRVRCPVRDLRRSRPSSVRPCRPPWLRHRRRTSRR